MLSADGCAVRVDNPASRFCAVWVGAAGEWRGSGGHDVQARWFGHAHLRDGSVLEVSLVDSNERGSLGKLLDLIEQAASLML